MSGTPYNARWRRLRAAYLSREPFCVECKTYGLLRHVVEVDHIVPIADDPSRIYDMSNLQGLCKSCHRIKTLEDYKGKRGVDVDGMPRGDHFWNENSSRKKSK